MPFFVFPTSFTDPIVAHQPYVNESRYDLVSLTDPVRDILALITDLRDFCEEDFPQYAFWVPGRHMIIYAAARVNKKRVIDQIVVLRCRVTPLTFHCTLPPCRCEMLRHVLSQRDREMELRSIDTVEGHTRKTSRVMINGALYDALYVAHPGLARDPYLHVPHIGQQEDDTVHLLFSACLDVLHGITSADDFVKIVLAQPRCHLSPVMHALDYVRDQFQLPGGFFDALTSVQRVSTALDEPDLERLRRKYGQDHNAK